MLFCFFSMLIQDAFMRLVDILTWFLCTVLLTKLSVVNQEWCVSSQTVTLLFFRFSNLLLFLFIFSFLLTAKRQLKRSKRLKESKLHWRFVPNFKECPLSTVQSVCGMSFCTVECLQRFFQLTNRKGTDQITSRGVAPSLLAWRPQKSVFLSFVGVKPPS